MLTNTFGGTVYITPASSGEDLLVLYGEVPSVNVCLKILQRFGDVEEIEIGGDNVAYLIPPGKTITGFVGHTSPAASGCYRLGSGLANLGVLID